MENSSSNQPVSKSCGSGVWTNLFVLAVGIVIGVLVAKYGWRATPTAQAGNAGSEGVAAASATTGPSAQSGEWNPMEQMRNMQAEIDQVFQRSFADLRINPKLKAFQEEPGYSLSMDVRDLKDRYQVQAFLPDTKASDVKVNLDGNQLKVDVANKTTEKETTRNGQATVQQWGHYEEVVQLAGELKQGQMQVQRKAHELIITVPKAS